MTKVNPGKIWPGVTLFIILSCRKLQHIARYFLLRPLLIVNQITQVSLWMVTLIKTDPLFEKLREDAEFQQIVRNVETKYQKGHQRIGKQLRKMGYY